MTTTKTIGKWLVVTFVLWYLLRQTTLGSAYSRDMMAIPQQLGVAEGLKSASQYIR
jgi:hypothetical protein